MSCNDVDLNIIFLFQGKDISLMEYFLTNNSLVLLLLGNQNKLHKGQKNGTQVTLSTVSSVLIA